MIQRTLIFLFLSFILSLTSLANPQDDFQKATTAYQNKDFKTAISTYESVLAEGMVSHELYYNLANSYFKTGAFAKSVLFYERALLLAPRDSDTQHNLRVVRQELVDDIEVLPPFFLAKWWRGLSQLSVSSVWSFLSILTMWLAIAGLVFWLIGKNRQQKKKGFIGGIILLLFSLLFWGLGHTRAAQESNSSYAILMSKEVVLRSAPDPESKAILNLHEGTKVNLKDQIGEWYKVRLANGEIGWLATNELEKI